MRIIGALMVAFVIVETPLRVRNNTKRALNNMNQINSDYQLDRENFQYMLEKCPTDEKTSDNWNRKRILKNEELAKQTAYLEKSFFQRICWPPTPFYIEDGDE